MNEKNRNTIAIISFIRRFITIFFNLFFNIYVLTIVNDFGFVLNVNIIGLIFSFIFGVIVLKYLNGKNARYLYNSSFIILVLCIGLLLLLKENIIEYIYIFKILYSLEEAFYYGPHEVILMGSNNHRTFSTFQANLTILNNISIILTPIFSGFIIENYSYTILFIILIIEAIIVMLIATRINKFYIDNRKTNVREFWDKAKKYNHIKDIYKCMFYRRISAQGAIIDLLPILLFLQLGSEFSVGTYTSFFAILSIIALTLLKFINKKKIIKNFYVPFSIIIFMSTLLLVFIPSFTTIFVYYVFMNTLATIIESESCSAVYEAIKVPELSKYGREHDIVFNIYMIFGQIISYGLVYLLYSYFYNKNILSIVISILMFFLIISCIYLQRAQNYFRKNKYRTNL